MRITNIRAAAAAGVAVLCVYLTVVASASLGTVSMPKSTTTVSADAPPPGNTVWN
jgi:hypothetical protein